MHSMDLLKKWVALYLMETSQDGKGAIISLAHQ